MTGKGFPVTTQHGGFNMALRINTNVASLNAHKNMVKNDNALSSSLERLSSGLRINKAADDASGMSIADSLRSQKNGLGQALKNANDGINIVQTADAALDESINIINTIKTKAIQAAQDGQTTESRAAIQSDINKLMDELDTIAKTTSFNNQKLLSGAFTNKQFQIGAYSGETVGISIASSESTKIGHTATSQLTLKDGQAGTVDLSIYSNLKNETFNIKSVEIAYDNTSEHGMGAVADAINQLSDTLGISASATVKSTTSLNIAAGTTDKGFAINGVTIGELEVSTNDSDGSLVKAINSKTSGHGVVASVDASGYLTLTSSDGRAIEVETGGTGTEAVLRDTDMTTVGYVTLNQSGSSEILVNNVGGGSAIALTNTLEIDGDSGETTIASTLKEDSVIADGSTLAAGWSTGQDITGDQISNSSTTTSQDSTFAAGSVLIASSDLAAYSDITDSVQIQDTSTTTGASTIAEGSILKATTEIAANTVLGGNVTMDTTNTTQTIGTSLIKENSVLEDHTTVAANTVLGGDFVTSGNTSQTVGDSLLTAGSVIAASSTIAANSVVGADVQMASGPTSTTEGESLLKAGSVIGSGSVIAAGSVLGGDVHLGQTAQNLTTSSSLLKAGSVIGSGSTIAANSVMGGDVALVSGTTTTATIEDSLLKTGSTIGSGSLIGKGSVFGADIVIGSGQTLTMTEDSVLTNNTEIGSGSTLKAGTVLAAGQYLNTTSGVVSGTLTKDYTTDTSNSQTLSDGGITSLKAGSVLTAATNYTIGLGSSLGADVYTNSGTTVLSEDMTLKSGSKLVGEQCLENRFLY